MMKKMVVCLMVVMLASAANAQNLLTNPSFEADTVADGDTLIGDPTDWNGWVGTFGVFNPVGDGTSDFDSAVPDGNNVLMCGDPADNDYSDVWQETVLFPDGVKVGQIINFSVKHAALASGEGIPHVEMWFYFATDTNPYVEPSYSMINLNRANDDRDWKEYTWSYTVTPEDEAAGYVGISPGVLGYATSIGGSTTRLDPVFFDDASLTLTFWEPSVPPASNPRPADGEEAVTVGTLLQWKPGRSPVYGWPTEHQVYFGTDRNAVLDANTSDPEYKTAVPEDGDSSSDLTGMVGNPSLETDVLADNTFLGSGPTSWDTWVSGVVDVWNPSGDGSGYFDSAVPDGDNVLQVGDGLTHTEIFQYVPIAGGLQANHVYTISAKQAGLSDDINPMWISLAIHASQDTADPNDLWGPFNQFDLGRPANARDWGQFSVDLDVDSLGVAGYDGISFGMVGWEYYDPSYYDDFRLSAYNPNNDPNYTPAIQNKVQYFWRIDEVYDTGGGETAVTTGEVWSFWTLRCGQTGQYYYPGDINQDCYVDLKDLALIALDWLKNSDPTE
ncbi:MAG: hypothetical protein MUO22_01595 [Sedimentisphaerales bacterium]|nr:hypothetical protein [Sedimentisphaerales bacterium]